MADAARRSPHPGRSTAIALAALAVVALQLALAWLSVRPGPRVPFGDELLYRSAAGAIASGAAFEPDPIWPVLYPELLAVLLRAFGDAALLPAAAVLQGALLLAAALLWADVARRLTGSRLAGAVAGLLRLVDPQVSAFAHYLWPEILHLFLFAAAVWLAIRAEDRALPLAGVGALLALAVLAKKLMWPFLPVFVWPAIVAGPDTVPGRARLRRAGFVAAGFVAGLLPAVAAFGPYAVSPVSSAVFNFWVGLNDTGRRSFSEPVVEDELARYESSGSEAGARDRATAAKVGERFAARGVVEVLSAQLRRQYFRLFDKDSFFTEQLPGGDIHRGGGGYRLAPGAIALAFRAWAYAIYGLVLVAAVVGAFLLSARDGRHRPWLRMLGLFVAYQIALFLFAHVKSRYRIPMLPVFDLWAGVAVAWGCGRLGFDSAAEPPFPLPAGRGRIVLATTAVAALLFCGFGG